MSGWDFLEAYENLPETEKGNPTIVMLTTSMNPDDEQRAAKFPQLQGFRFKPLDKEMLSELLESNFPDKV